MGFLNRGFCILVSGGLRGAGWRGAGEGLGKGLEGVGAGLTCLRFKITFDVT